MLCYKVIYFWEYQQLCVLSKYIKHQRSSDDEYVKLFLYLSKYAKPAEFRFAENLLRTQLCYIEETSTLKLNGKNCLRCNFF